MMSKLAQDTKRNRDGWFCIICCVRACARMVWRVRRNVIIAINGAHARVFGFVFGGFIMFVRAGLSHVISRGL